jgi:predicted ester cyclase
MSLEQNKSLVRRYFEAFQTGDGTIYDGILDEAFTVRTLREQGEDLSVNESGPALFKRLLLTREASFTDITLTVDEIVAEGDRVMVAWTFCGRHTGDFFGVPPTGKQIIYRGANSFQVSNGKLLASWDLKDSLFLFQQVGALPSSAEIFATAKVNNP